MEHELATMAVCVKSIAELKALSAGARPCITVLGYHEPGDGGGGNFYWENSSSDADDRGTVITPASYPPSNPALGRWKRLWSGALNVRWFGARGDWNEVNQTGTDDYEALQAAAAAINAMRGGTLIFPPGTYRIDRYKIHDAFHTPPKVDNGVRDIVYANCTGLRIIGYGAKIDVKGDFFRAADHHPNQFWYSNSDTVRPFLFSECTNFRLEGFELNGNVDKTTRGHAPDGSLVVEGLGYGIFTSLCRQYTFANLFIHHFQTDGIALGAGNRVSNTSVVADRDAVLVNVRSLYNARTGLGIFQLRGGSFTRCAFSKTGRAKGTYGGHAPQCGVDIEPGYTTVAAPGGTTADVLTGDLTFIDCAFVNNVGQGLSVAPSAGESLFKRCVFWGTAGSPTAYSIWAQAPKLTFEDCEIYGECTNQYASSVADDTTKYIRCHFEDKRYPGASGAFPNVACISTTGNVQLDACVIVANKTRGVYLDGASMKHILRNTTIIHKYDGLDNGTFQSLLRDCVLDQVHFAEDMKNSDRRSWFLNVSRSSEILNHVVVDGPNVLWGDENTGARLQGKVVGINRPIPRASLELNHNMNRAGPYQGFGTIAMSAGLPTLGSWNKGDVIFDQAPEPGKKVGWVCVASGTAGTSTPPSWRAFGQIDANP